MDEDNKYDLHLDEMTKSDIYQAIDDGLISESYPKWYYCNSQWDDEL